MILEIALSPEVRGVVAALHAAGGHPLVVGGRVRDALAGLPLEDVDLEVYGLSAEAIEEVLKRSGKVHAVGKSFGIFKLALNQEILDVALPRRESKTGRGHRGFMVEADPSMTPQEAAARRDFTINAMAWDPVSREVLDFFGGLDDLKQRRLRHTSPAFVEDPLRVLRGMQFAARFDLNPDETTLRLCAELFREYDTLAIERIWGEWWKWAAKASRPSAGLRFLRDSGWRLAYPELAALEGCPQEPDWHPEGDVWTHTLLVVDEAAAIAARDDLGEEDRGVLVLAGLVHDLGKPETTLVENGRIRSPGHTATVHIFQRFLQRIGAPSRLSDRVIALSREHLCYLDFSGSARQVRRLARRLGEGGETIQNLARLTEADHGGRAPLPKGLPAAVADLLRIAQDVAAIDAVPKPLLLGRHLIPCGIPPGPAMGECLKAAYEAQLDGAFDSLEGGLNWVRTHFPELMGG